jgi:alanyl-tRNA synthetase
LLIKVVDELKEIFSKEPALYVGVVNKTGNTKALAQGITFVKSINKPALLVVVDPENSKVNYQCVVPKEQTAKLDASIWAQVVADVVGGKKGGNNQNAQGAGDNINQVDDAVRLAQEFATKLLL